MLDRLSRITRPGRSSASSWAAPRSRRSPPAIESLEGRHLLSQVFEVTSTLDSEAAGTLRWAIARVNADETSTPLGPDEIRFAIPTTDSGYDPASGVWTVSPSTALPGVTRPVFIDGYTQTGARPNASTPADDAVLTVRLDGAAAETGSVGLSLAGGSSQVRGLAVTRFGTGIRLSGPGSDRVTGNFIGVAPSGINSARNRDYGLVIDGASSVTVGGTSRVDRNVISSNGSGVNFDVGQASANILARDSSRLVVQGNLIGTDRTGTSILGYSFDSIKLLNSPAATIGGDVSGSGNVIAAAGSSGRGVEASLLGTEGILIAGNKIGTDVTGSIALRNGGGLDILSGTVRGNVISGNYRYGLTIGEGCSVVGNFLGTDATGTTAIPNGGGIYSLGGAHTIGGTSTAQRNVISGNDGSGMFFTRQGPGANLISGNFIGVDVTGTRALGNSGNGITIYDESDNTIGGTAAGAGNVISANAGVGLLLGDVYSDRNLIQGNFIGTNAAGNAALGNGDHGIILECGQNTLGGTVSGAGNVISGNRGSGVLMTGQFGSGRNLVQGNSVGTDATGESAIPNLERGLFITNRGNTVGGSSAQEGNIIAYNGQDGVRLEGFVYGDPTNVAILSNSIFRNAGLGIRLAHADGAQDGPNHLQPAPELVYGASTPSSTTIRGRVRGAVDAAFTVQFFADSIADPTGFGQGRIYLGQLLDVRTDASGLGDFSFVVPGDFRGQFISATATDPGNNTSEFARDIVPTSVLVADLLASSSAGTPSSEYGGTASYTFTVRNAGPSDAMNVVLRDVLPPTLRNVQVATIGEFTLVDGVFTQAIALLPAGSSVAVTIIGTAASVGTLSHTLVATSATPDPEPSDNSATAATIVDRTPLGTNLAVSAPFSTFGEPVGFSVRVPGALDAPTGMVLFAIDGQPVAVVPLQPAGGFSASATFTTTALGAGGHRVTSSYLGDANYAPGLASEALVSVARAATATALTAVPATTVAGAPVMLRAAVAGPPVPTGTVTFYDGATELGRAPLDNAGVAQLVAPGLAAGTHALTARYDGDADRLPSDSAAIPLSIAPPAVSVVPVVASVTRIGFHAQPTRIRITFSTAMDAARATVPTNYRIAGPRGRFTPPRSAWLSGDGLTVTLRTRPRLNLRDPHRLIVAGTPTSGLTSSRGVYLAGRGDGVPGSDFVTWITRRNLVPSRQQVPNRS